MKCDEIIKLPTFF